VNRIIFSPDKFSIRKKPVGSLSVLPGEKDPLQGVGVKSSGDDGSGVEDPAGAVVSVGGMVEVGLGTDVLVGGRVLVVTAVRVVAIIATERAEMVACMSGVATGAGAGPQAVKRITHARIKTSRFIKQNPYS